MEHAVGMSHEQMETWETRRKRFQEMNKWGHYSCFYKNVSDSNLFTPVIVSSVLFHYLNPILVLNLEKNPTHFEPL